ncbi:MAG: HAD-IIIA family hydrolase [Magnetococcales bacterium]|nr:HAD-IIIA family hydrolase [Magnetococcales bacterium]
MIFPWHLGREIRVVALDCDGVLTDGGIHLDGAGQESKRFHVTDGLGIRLLLDAGIAVGLISARQSQAVSRRGEELSLSFVHQGVRGSKWLCLQAELMKLGCDASQCAAMGDDLVDLDILCRVGLASAPRDAAEEVQRRVHWVASASGGHGAVRELAEGLLMSQGRWETTVARFIPQVAGRVPVKNGHEIHGKP